MKNPLVSQNKANKNKALFLGGGVALDWHHTPKETTSNMAGWKKKYNFFNRKYIEKPTVDSIPGTIHPWEGELTAHRSTRSSSRAFIDSYRLKAQLCGTQGHRSLLGIISYLDDTKNM